MGWQTLAFQLWWDSKIPSPPSPFLKLLDSQISPGTHSSKQYWEEWFKNEPFIWDVVFSENQAATRCGFDTQREGQFCVVLVLFWTVCHSITIQSRRRTWSFKNVKLQCLQMPPKLETVQRLNFSDWFSRLSLKVCEPLTKALLLQSGSNVLVETSFFWDALWRLT